MKKYTVANFVQKLDEILEESQYEQIIAWTLDGDSFVIKSVTKLTDIVLPKYFKHQNYSSFNRQLNMYCFVKILSETDQIVYRNPHFLRFNKQQYRYIKRKSKLETDIDNKAQVSPYQTGDATEELRQLNRRQFRLQGICKGLFDENQTIIAESSRLWKKMSQRLDRKNNQLSALLCFLLLRSQNKQLIHSLPIMDQAEDSEPELSDSSDSQDLIEHVPRNFNRLFLPLLETKGLNIQDVLTFFKDHKSKQKEIILQDAPLMDEFNLCLKEHGESLKSRNEKQASFVEKQNSIISDVNYFLNKSNEEIKDLSDYSI